MVAIKIVLHVYVQSIAHKVDLYVNTYLLGQSHL